MIKCLTILFCVLAYTVTAQDTLYIKVHFLYGSKPLKAYKQTEPKWFGGMLGGHVGIEADSNRVFSFVPRGKFHWFAQPNKCHSAFVTHSVEDFYGILGSNAASVKKTIITIPVTAAQKILFDSICQRYSSHPPYDYALWGMRCGAAAYDILAQMDILPAYSYRKTYRKIFYPRKLRKRLLKKAKQHHWKIIQQEGVTTRRWEKDR